jgi:hypothetical protein
MDAEGKAVDRDPVSRRIDGTHVQDRGKRCDLPAPKILAAIGQLAEAHRYAADTGQGVCDFAVEIGSLGPGPNDFRWLLSKGYLHHAQEVSQGKKRQRRATTFCATHPTGCCGQNRPRSSPHGVFGRPTGRASPLAVVFCSPRPDWNWPTASRAPAHASVTPHFQRLLRTACTPPRWFRTGTQTGRELWLGDSLVKRFRQPSRCQESILLEFQRVGWPRSIDNPLPYDAEQEPKDRLRQAIHRLNLHQKNNRIYFEANGTGERICWKLLP